VGLSDRQSSWYYDSQFYKCKKLRKYFLLLLLRTDHLLLKKKPDILDIFVTKLPNSLYSNIKNILDLNSDHFSVLLTLNASSPIQQISPKLFNRFTDCLKFHDTVNENIKLNIRLNIPDDIDLAVMNLTNIIQTAAWSTTITNSSTPHISNPLPEIIRTLITEKCRARACYQRTRLLSHEKMYNQLAHSLKKTSSLPLKKTRQSYVIGL